LSFRLPDLLVALCRKLGRNFDAETLPMPARFVIGGDGIVRYAAVEADCGKRPDPQELLPVLQAAAQMYAAAAD